jgi:hypothetical protein
MRQKFQNCAHITHKSKEYLFPSFLVFFPRTFSSFFFLSFSFLLYGRPLKAAQHPLRRYAAPRRRFFRASVVQGALSILKEPKTQEPFHRISRHRIFLTSKLS